MNTKHLASLLVLTACQSAEPMPAEPISSRMVQTEAEDLVLVQEVLVEAPAQSVWQAYTTEAGWRKWASPAVEIDLRAGGTIRTHYGEGAAIGDPGTNTLHIVNYVPKLLLTLRADVEAGWPEVMKQNAGNLMNVIVFDPLGPERTRILSYGVGYRDTDAYDELMGFFLPANEGLFRILKESLEQ